MTASRSGAFAHGVRLGLPADAVELVPYDDRWPALYESEAALLHAGLQGQISGVAHIGSTAIIGMAAKPVIDLMIAIVSLRAPSLLHWSLQRYGYELQVEDPLPDRLFFVRANEGMPTHHLSACEPASEFWTTHLAFRDRLRANPQRAAEYLALKRKLCGRHPTDRASYTAGKEDFIAAVLRG